MLALRAARRTKTLLSGTPSTPGRQRGRRGGRPLAAIKMGFYHMKLSDHELLTIATALRIAHAELRSLANDERLPRAMRDQFAAQVRDTTALRDRFEQEHGLF